MTPPARKRGRAADRRTVASAAPTADVTIGEAKQFMNGRSQAVRLPADCRFDGDAVYVKRWRNAVVLLPKDDPWRPLLESLGHFSDDFMQEREQPRTQDRRDDL
jgi:antitoxin VapB